MAAVHAMRERGLALGGAVSLGADGWLVAAGLAAPDRGGRRSPGPTVGGAVRVLPSSVDLSAYEQLVPDAGR